MAEDVEPCSARGRGSDSVKAVGRTHFSLSWAPWAEGWRGAWIPGVPNSRGFRDSVLVLIMLIRRAHTSTVLPVCLAPFYTLYIQLM